MSDKKKIVRDYSEMDTSDLKKMIQKDSGASRQAAKAAFKELEKREGDMGYSVTLILGGRKREPDTMDLPKSKPTKMARGGMAYGKEHMYVAGGSVQMNPGLKALKAASPEAYNKITGK
tara:strand:- start:341 stop:697 length:357 start_codon:yes stop_codon:yes gene_type:complete